MKTEPWPCIVRVWVLIAAGAVLAPVPLFAAQHDVRILLDLDNDTATGCTVPTVAGPFAGVEQILVTTVETTSPPPAGAVTDLAVSDCVEPATDTFGPPASFDGGWPIGIDDGEGGLHVIETYFPLLSSVVPDPTRIRFAATVTDELGGEQALLTRDGTPGGPPILIELGSVPEILEIPTLGDWGLISLALLLAGGSIVVLRRRGAGVAAVALVLAGSGLAWAAPGLDGLTDDWLLPDRVAGNGVVLWAKTAGDQLCFRIDADLLFDTAPAITSADATAFTVGSAGSFTVTADGLPTPAFTIGGDPLPAGVGFDTTSGVLSGTPDVGTGGIYSLSFTATNAAGSSVTQSFTLAVHERPAITSPDATTFLVGSAGSFTVTAQGFPAPAFTIGGDPLPAGVSFDTASGVLSGTPDAGTGGTYGLSFAATNAAGSSAAQAFTLSVHEVPTFLSATSAIFRIRIGESFTVVTDGFPTAALTLGGDPLPGTVSFTDNGDRTATLAGTPGAGDLGTYALTFTADNGNGAPVVQNFTFSVILASYADFMLPSGHSFVIGMGAIGANGFGAIGGNLYVFTSSQIFTLPLNATSGTFTQQPFGPQEVGVRISPLSWAVPSPIDPNIVFYTGGTGAIEQLYSYRLSPEGQTPVPIDSGRLSGRPPGLAVEASTGVVLVSRPASDGGGVSKLAPDGTPTLTFGNSGPGTLTAPGALAFAPDGLLYVLDTAVNRVFSFASDGEYQNDFSLVGTAANTLAIDSTGRLFTMTGAGGGEIYDAITGIYLGAFAPSSVGEPGLGKPLLTVAGDTLYAFDDTTGLHSYDLSPP